MATVGDMLENFPLEYLYMILHHVTAFCTEQ